MTVEEYLANLREEGCTYVAVVAKTGNPDFPVIVRHDGDTCPIHEAE